VEEVPQVIELTDGGYGVTSRMPVEERSELLDGPAVQGAITPDPRTKKEQFVIQAKPKSTEQADETREPKESKEPPRGREQS